MSPKKPTKPKLGPVVIRKKGGRLERDAGTGKYVPKGTEKRKPGTTVTEPRSKSKSGPKKK